MNVDSLFEVTCATALLGCGQATRVENFGLSQRADGFRWERFHCQSLTRSGNKLYFVCLAILVDVDNGTNITCPKANL